MRRGNGGEGEDIPLLIFIEGERCQIQQSLRQTKAKPRNFLRPLPVWSLFHWWYFKEWRWRWLGEVRLLCWLVWLQIHMGVMMIVLPLHWSYKYNNVSPLDSDILPTSFLLLYLLSLADSVRKVLITPAINHYRLKFCYVCVCGSSSKQIIMIRNVIKGRREK